MGEIITQDNVTGVLDQTAGSQTPGLQYIIVEADGPRSE